MNSLYEIIKENKLDQYLTDKAEWIFNNGTEIILTDNCIDINNESNWIFLSLDVILRNNEYVPLYRVYKSTNENEMVSYENFNQALNDFNGRIGGY